MYYSVYLSIKDKCRKKIEELAKELQKALEEDQVINLASDELMKIFREEVEDVIENFVDQVETISWKGTVKKNTSRTHIPVFYSSSPSERKLGKEKKIDILKENENPSKEK